MYADDTTLLIADSNLHDFKHRATDLFGSYSVWFKDLHTMNANKSQCMFYFCNSYDLPNTLSFDDHVVSRVDCVQFLGFYVDSILHWDKHIEQIRVKTSRCIGRIKLCKFLPKTCLILMHNAIMLPFISRGIECWGVAMKYLMDPLQVLQKRYIRIFSHIHPREHTTPFAKDLHILLLYDLYFFKTACLMFSVMNNACCDVLCNLFMKRSDIHNRLTCHANISF